MKYVLFSICATAIAAGIERLLTAAENQLSLPQTNSMLAMGVGLIICGAASGIIGAIVAAKKS